MGRPGGGGPCGLLVGDTAVTEALRDGEGRTFETLTLPDRRANFWVRHRQALLAQGLTDDLPVQPRAGEAIPAPGQPVAAVAIWDVAEGSNLTGSDQQFEQVTLTPRHVGALTEFSRQLLQQASPDVEQLVRNDMALVIAEALDTSIAMIERLISRELAGWMQQ